ncbi:MAG: DUF1800 domain-containing protein, partial [Cyanobacteria bacterium J06623_7]
ASQLSPHQQHVLSRLSFGITSAEREQVAKIGLEAYIQSQLKPDSIRESAKLASKLNSLGIVRRGGMNLLQENIAANQKIKDPQLSVQQVAAIRKKNNKLNGGLNKQLVEAHIARAIYSERQLQQVMVDFWLSHFNVDLRKNQVKFWLDDYEQQIRDRALGNFYGLLLATARHPAMSIYLDNRTSIAPNSPAGKRTKQGLNENYAREVMELHTIGINGGYSQDDIISLARIFTGWSVDNRGTRGNKKGFFFNHNRHDPTDKVFLGHKIAGGGVEEGEKALQILANHPATASSIAYKLAQYFVADVPPESLVERLSKSFLNSRGNIAMVMDTLIHSPEFNDPSYYGQKFTTPFQYIISLVRMGEIVDPGLPRLRGMFHQLSMPVFHCPTPDGYKNTQSAWLNPQAMLQRTGLATAIANGVLNRSSPVDIETVAANMGEISPSTKQVVAKTPKQLQAALVMGSPEAMYR